LSVNIATFALGRRAPLHGAEALALLGLDGEIDASVAQKILAVPSVTDARLVRLPEKAKAEVLN
jgi:hypothetical protein